jgi:hypothetical protein
MKRALLALAFPLMAAPPTYNGEIANLLHRHCTACHRPGQVGPFDFTNYDTAAAYAPELSKYILGEKMPPWRAKPGPIAFSNNRRLPEEATAKILAWINAGTPQGAPAPAPPKRHPLWHLGEPDEILSQPAEHTVSGETTVDIVTLRFPPAPKDRHLRAFEFRPSNRALLHHALLRAGSQPLAAWAMCDNGIQLPAGTAWVLPKDTPLEIELHYFKRTLRPARDLTRIALYYAKSKPTRQAYLLTIQKTDLRIPANANLHQETTTYTLPDSLHLLSILPVFQLLAEDLRLSTPQQSLLWVRPYEHHLMTTYTLARPLPLPKGQPLKAEATYDNSTQNEFNPHKTPREVRAAENGLDETFRFHLTVSKPYSP